MFSIAAINDTDSKSQWEPLAPTKEAQEFHLTQTYHEGLLKLQAKEYEKARELLELVLKDPLISNVQVDSNTTDGHLLQLKFLALKNLATVFLQQGSSHYESALRCYLQAVEIDNKDSVVWNQLGTLSCSMGSLSISRWAFEQGLLCSPNNWNCMEKLLEVLIAIGDEVACLSVAELILRHWPSHSRALLVKSTIEETELVPFAPRGIDKLEPKHARLKFHDKRKAPDEDLDEGSALKKLNQNIDLQLTEASWAALADALVGILLPLKGCGLEVGSGKLRRSGDVRLSILVTPSSEVVMEPFEKKVPAFTTSCDMPPSDCDIERASNMKEKEPNFLEDQPQERRSTRLRSRKPDKEEIDFSVCKDLAKVVLQFLEPFVISRPEDKDSDNAVNANYSITCTDKAESLDMECKDVANFVRETSKNYGAYHMSHLLLEHAASRCLVHAEAHVKYLELEKLTRHWGQDRTPECSLFLAELYYDIGSSPSNSSKLSEFLSEASYHLCKVIESVALDHPFHMTTSFGNENCSSLKIFQGTDAISPNNCESSSLDGFLLSNKSSFWVRYFWLSGQLSALDGNKAKAYEEFCISLSLLAKKEKPNNSLCMVQLPHCKIIKELTVERILHEINLLKVDFLLEKTIGEMIEKEMYLECVTSLAPLLFSVNCVSPLPAADQKGEGITSVELSALDILIKACEKINPMDFEVYLNSHIRKLQILAALAGMGECISFCKPFHQKSRTEMLSGSEMVSRHSSRKHWKELVAEEVKAISQCVSQMKNFIDQSGDSNGTFLVSVIGDIQSLLLAIMYSIANNVLCKKSSMPVILDQLEQKQSNCFIDAAIAFCKLQHLDTSVTIKTQVELIVAIHDLLAEYGLCCAGSGGEGEEGTFLRFAIKHLLALDMKLKSSFNSSKRETSPFDIQPTCDSDVKTSQNETSLDKLDGEMGGTENSESVTLMKDDIEGITSEGTQSCSGQENDNAVVHEKQCTNDDKISLGEGSSDEPDECTNELTEDEKEDLELTIENALDQCFFCLYGLNLRSDSSYDDELAVHKNASRGDYQTKEQCADVFQYILPSAKASSRTGLVKLRRVLRTIRKHFPQPPEDLLAGNIIDKFLDDPDLCEDKLSEMAGSEGYLETIKKMLFPNGGSLKQYKASSFQSSEPYLEVYSNLYYFLAQSEEMNATDKWPGFVLTKEGEEFVQQNANLFKYDLLYNPLRFESWQRLANIYDEEVDLLLNDGSKHINVSGWRKNTTLPQRVETSRRRSRRCLLISLALAKTSDQQCEIHELLALVYYDSLQNVVPFFDQRSVVPSRDAAWRMYCENSLRHFKKAFMHKQDWSHAFYIGKLCQKLGSSIETSLSYYDKAIALNPSAVDPFYRMHASRLKLLWTCGKQNLEVLKVISTYSSSQSVKDDVMGIISGMTPATSTAQEGMMDQSCLADLEEKPIDDTKKMEEVWNMLYNDCLSALEICVGGDLKHFHKARFMLAQGLYRKGGRSDLLKAKDELSFCFKSSRSSFTIYMWEIDGMVKKGKRKTPNLAGNKKALEVNLPESSRKFITCIRKYLLFYLKLLEETGDICTLDRAYASLRSDKRFSLCIEDIVPVALGRHIKALVLSMNQVEPARDAASSFEHKLEKIFGLFMEQGTLWPEICCLPEIKSSEISEGTLYGYLHQYIVSLERNGKLETVEAINERIRKRFKNPKLSNTNCAKVCRHASVAWCRTLIISLASITPFQSGFSSEIQTLNQADGALESSHQLCIDLQTHEIWNSSFEDSTHLESLQTKWNPTLTKINNIIIKKASDGDLETANALLKSSYNFYRESSCVMLPSGVNISLVPSRLVKEQQFPSSMEGVETLDLSIPRKLLLWAYTLLNGRYASISVVVKHCEETAKLKMKRGATTSPAPQSTNTPTSVSNHTAVGSSKDTSSQVVGSEPEAAPATSAAPAQVPEGENRRSTSPLPSSSEGQRSLIVAPQPQPFNSNEGERSSVPHEGDPIPNKG